MILSILKVYFSLLLSIGAGALFMLVLGLYLILRKPRKSAATVTVAITKTAELHNIDAIAGDDVMTTQLDLARAYLETGKSHLATQILEHVISQGNIDQQQEAQQLMNAR